MSIEWLLHLSEVLSLFHFQKSLFRIAYSNTSLFGFHFSYSYYPVPSPLLLLSPTLPVSHWMIKKDFSTIASKITYWPPFQKNKVPFQSHNEYKLSPLSHTTLLEKGRQGEKCSYDKAKMSMRTHIKPGHILKFRQACVVRIWNKFT